MFESDLVRLRTKEGMKVAKAKGCLRGKQPKLNRRQEAHLVSLVHSGQYSSTEVAELSSVSRSTVYRAIERQRGEALAGLAGPPRQAEQRCRRRCPTQHTHAAHRPSSCSNRNVEPGERSACETAEHAASLSKFIP